MSKKSYKLIYFRARGRGEFIRLVFLIAGVEFEDHLVDFQQNWPSLKASGIAPFGQLPLLEITDDSSPTPILLCQSVAIMRYLAIEFGLAPESNLEKALADMVVDAVMQIRAKIRKCRFTTDATLKEKLLKEFQGALPNDLKNLEKILQANRGGKGYFVSKELSYADISFFDFMNSWVAKDKINGYPTELEDFPLLRGLYERVRDIPAVKQRLKTRPDTAL
ncbi:hypothetical protein ABFA07_019697 [Porites harrisoni]